MNSSLPSVLIFSAAISTTMPSPAVEPSLPITNPGDKLHLTGIVDTQMHLSDSIESWTRRSTGKLFYDEASNGELHLQGIGIKFDYDLNSSSTLNLVTHFYNEPETRFEVTEAFWNFRPISRNAWRSNFRLGAFYPKISLENRGPLWNSPYTMRPSVLNTWVGEELRTFGAEGTLQWRGDPMQRSPHRVSLTAALFWRNDPTGALISWRGWAAHQRQTGIDGTLPLAPIPFLSTVADRQHDYIEPFLELDNDPGIYGAIRYSYQRAFSVQVFFYDNRTDDQIVENGQYGWHTQFGQLSAKLHLGTDTQLLTQYLKGKTTMALDTVDNDFKSFYTMFVHDFGKHRISARYETFDVVDNDTTPMDSNAEHGDSQTISYSYLWRDHWKLTVEATRIESDRESRKYFGHAIRQTETQFSLGLRYFFDLNN